MTNFEIQKGRVPQSVLENSTTKKRSLFKNTYPMKSFIHDDFLLQTDAAKELYARPWKINPSSIINVNLNPDISRRSFLWQPGEIWLEGDHYKWRVCAPTASRGILYRRMHRPEKIHEVGETVPYTMRTPCTTGHISNWKGPLGWINCSIQNCKGNLRCLYREASYPGI